MFPHFYLSILISQTFPIDRPSCFKIPKGQEKEAHEWTGHINAVERVFALFVACQFHQLILPFSSASAISALASCENTSNLCVLY